MCWNEGRLCWKIAKLFYFCHLKKLVRPETFGLYYVPKVVFMHSCKEIEQKIAVLTEMHEIQLLWFGWYTALAVQKLLTDSLPPAPSLPVSKPILWVKSTICSVTGYFEFATECMCFVCVHRKHHYLSYTALIDCIL